MHRVPRASILAVKRIVYKEVPEGDWRKFRAQSNNAASGGGARDLRFRPYDEFAKIFALLFPQARSELRRRGGKKVGVKVYWGTLHWTRGGTDGSREARFEPPTDSRPYEGRVPVIYKYPPFKLVPTTNEGRIVVMLVQRNDDTVWPEFVTEQSLRSGAWEASISAPILRSLDAPRSARQVARGYIDLVRNVAYSDA